MGIKVWWRNRPAVQRRNELQEERREYQKSLEEKDKQEKEQIAQQKYIQEGSAGRRTVSGVLGGFRKGATVVGRTAADLPYKVGRGEKSVIGIAFDKILTWFFGLAKILAILLIISLVILIPTRLYATGTTDYALTKTGVVLSDTGTPLAKTGLARVWDIFYNPNIPLTEGSFALEKADENKFVEIKDASAPSKFESKAPILITADFLAHNLEKDSTAVVSAELNEYEGEVIVKLPVKEGSEENKIILPKEQEYPFTATLLFPEGIETEKGIEGARGTVKITYEATAESTWRAYGLHSDIEGEERFKNLKELDDPLITSNGIGKSSLAYDSPIRITFTVNNKQPFKEDIFYFFSLDLRKDALTKGNIKKLNRFLLYVPENILLEDDRRLCHFEKVESTEADQLIVYKVTDPFLNYVNTDCSLADKKDCELIYKEENHAFCRFKFKDLPKEQNPIFVEFRALAEYTFTVEKPFFVGLIPSKTTVGDLCKPIINENECKQAKGCKPVYSIAGSFNSCETCQLDLLQCSDYDNENDCSNDLCNLGNCAWRDNACKDEVIA